MPAAHVAARHSWNARYVGLSLLQDAGCAVCTSLRTVLCCAVHCQPADRAFAFACGCVSVGRPSGRMWLCVSRLRAFGSECHSFRRRACVHACERVRRRMHWLLEGNETSVRCATGGAAGKQQHEREEWWGWGSRRMRTSQVRQPLTGGERIRIRSAQRQRAVYCKSACVVPITLSVIVPHSVAAQAW